MFPIKHTIEGDGVTLERTYRNLEIDGGIDDERFAFDPQSATRNETITLPSINSYETVDAADEAVPFGVAEPPADALPLPDGLDSTRLRAMSSTARTGRRCRSSTGRRATKRYRSSRATARGGSQSAVTRSRSGASRERSPETDQGTELQWSCGERYHSVFASHAFDDGTALRVSQSLETGC